MVYGNYNSGTGQSGTGVLFTRSPATGENVLYGAAPPLKGGHGSGAAGGPRRAHLNRAATCSCPPPGLTPPHAARPLWRARGATTHV